MHGTMRQTAAFLIFLSASSIPSLHAFQSRSRLLCPQAAFELRSRCIRLCLSDEKQTETTNTTTKDGEAKLSFYRLPNGAWQPRINLADLKIGQQLSGKVVQELLVAKTGPKLYFECGVGRIDSKGDWQIVNGMMRLGGKGAKASVTQKRATRLRRKDKVDLYISRIQLECARLEVCATPEEVQNYQRGTLSPASSLKPGQELVGEVKQVTSFGVFVDVGANRKGLLHIQKVADLYGRYIDKEKGLEEAGLERGAKIRVAVATNERKRLFLDFTKDVKEAADEERRLDEEERTGGVSGVLPQQAPESDWLQGADDESSGAWAAYDTIETEEDEDDEDDFDEDAAIEDAFGLGIY